MFTREAIVILRIKSDMLQSLVTPCGMLGGMYGMENCATFRSSQVFRKYADSQEWKVVELSERKKRKKREKLYFHFWDEICYGRDLSFVEIFVGRISRIPFNVRLEVSFCRSFFLTNKRINRYPKPVILIAPIAIGIILDIFLPQSGSELRFL